MAELSTYLAAAENKWLPGHHLPSSQVAQAENRKFTFISHYFLSYLMGAMGMAINI